jgi:hypothetical protein
MQENAGEVKNGPVKAMNCVPPPIKLLLDVNVTTPPEPTEYPVTYDKILRPNAGFVVSNGSTVTQDLAAPSTSTPVDG